MTLADAFGVLESDARRWPPDVTAVLARVARRRGWLIDIDPIDTDNRSNR